MQIRFAFNAACENWKGRFDWRGVEIRKSRPASRALEKRFALHLPQPSADRVCKCLFHTSPLFTFTQVPVIVLLSLLTAAQAPDASPPYWRPRTGASSHTTDSDRDRERGVHTA